MFFRLPLCAQTPSALTAPPPSALRPHCTPLPFSPSLPHFRVFKKFQIPSALTPTALTQRFAHTAPTLCPYRSHPLTVLNLTAPTAPSESLRRFKKYLEASNACPNRPLRPHRPQRFAHTAPTLCPHPSKLATPPSPPTSLPAVPIAHTALTLATPSQCFAHSLHGFRPHRPHQPECPNPSSSVCPEAEHCVSPNTSPHHAELELELPQLLAADWTCNQYS